MSKWHFVVVLVSDEYQTLGITIIFHVYHVLIIGCVFYTLCPVCAYSCIGHTSHMHTRCTFAAHTLTLDKFCIHSCQLSLFRPFSTYNVFLCPCRAQVYIMFHHPQYIMFTLCFVAFFFNVFVLCLSFIFSFILHPSYIIFYPCSYLLFFPSFLLIHLSIRYKKRESILESISECIVISI